jgi:glucose-6-phosphate 1-dehydrogenase
MNKRKLSHPFLITIFGAKGDLTRRKLIPALYNLYTDGHLPEIFAIYCIDYLASDEAAFKQDFLEGINEFSRNGIAEEIKWKEFATRLFYIQGDFQEDDTFLKLKENASHFGKQNGRKISRIFYFATAPRFIEIIAEGLYKHKLCNRVLMDRIVVEKAFWYKSR